MFKRKINDKAVEIILKENERLKRENLRLQDSLDEIAKYKEEYKNLIQEVNALKKQYSEKISEMDIFIEQYNKEIDFLMTEVNNGIK